MGNLIGFFFFSSYRYWFSLHLVFRSAALSSVIVEHQASNFSRLSNSIFPLVLSEFNPVFKFHGMSVQNSHLSGYALLHIQKGWERHTHYRHALKNNALTTNVLDTF